MPQKVGQHPSVEHFAEPNTEYSGIISSERLSELALANRLYEQNIGAGSFVYLRKIFEAMISETYIEHVSSGQDDVDAFNKLRLKDKAKKIKEFLPPFINNHHANIYAILSEGVHCLTEEQCLEHFELLKRILAALFALKPYD